MEYLIANGKVDSQKTFLKKIGFEHTNNFNQVSSGARSFRMDHVQNCCRLYNADANFFFAQRPEGMFRKKDLPAMQQLKAATRLVELEMKELKKWYHEFCR